MIRTLTLLLALSACDDGEPASTEAPGDTDQSEDTLSTPGDDDSAGSGDDGENSGDDGGDSTADLAGSWLTTSEEMTLDDCGMAEWVTDGPGGTLLLTLEQESDLLIEHSQGVESCVLTGDEYGCDSREDTDTTAIDEYGLDATILLTLSASGWFDGPDALVMSTDIVVNCEGDDCWLVELSTAWMPCEMSVQVEAIPQ